MNQLPNGAVHIVDGKQAVSVALVTCLGLGAKRRKTSRSLNRRRAPIWARGEIKLKPGRLKGGIGRSAGNKRRAVECGDHGRAPRAMCALHGRGADAGAV